MVKFKGIIDIKVGGRSVMWIQVGERIRQLRSEHNLSRAQFGKMIDLSEQYVGKIERGAHSISGKAIAKICNVMDVSADYILFGIIDPTDTVSVLSGLSREQIEIGLDVLKRLAQLINTNNGNNALIQEVLLQQQSNITHLQI